jgi:hypothetical protein
MMWIKFSEWVELREGYNAPRKGMKSRWSTSYKKSINCSHPKGFSQKNYCKRKSRGGQYTEQSTVGTEEVDFSQIEQRYSKTKISVMLVRLYDQMTNQKLLTNISTIANLSGSAYGVYVSSENKKVIGSDIVNKIKLIYPNDPSLGEKLQKLPKKVLMQYMPHLDDKKIVPSDVIHVDVNRHLSNLGDSPAAIIEIASTIVHEATHVLEYETTGQTKDGPNTAVEVAERKFKAWVQQNWKMLQQKFGFQGEYPFRN